MYCDIRNLFIAEICIYQIVLLFRGVPYPISSVALILLDL